MSCTEEGIMRAEIWAVLTAVCWAVGSFFEKKGVKLGEMSPAMGATLRTCMSVAILGMLSFPYWRQVKSAGTKPLLMVILGGGILSGALGILFLYRALNGGNLSVVLPIAFCLTPVLGAVLGIAFLDEKTHVLQLIGIALTVIGASMTAYFRVH